MENKVLTDLINSLLPSVEGETENLITAEKLRTVLLEVYDKSVTDSLTVSKGALSCTYDELARYKTGATLIPGQYYSFTYQSPADLEPNFKIDNFANRLTIYLKSC